LGARSRVDVDSGQEIQNLFACFLALLSRSRFDAGLIPLDALQAHEALRDCRGSEALRERLEFSARDLAEKLRVILVFSAASKR
jgi:hypothetical protein